MSIKIFELRQISDESVGPEEKVLFDVQSSPIPEGMEYNKFTGEITFNEIGTYSIKWWVATRTTLHGAIKFELVVSHGGIIIDRIRGCSPQKNGQVSGFAAINVTEAGTKLSLVNQTESAVVFSSRTDVNALLLITPLITDPDAGTIVPFSTGDRPNILETNNNGERSGVSILGFGNAGEFYAPNDPIEFLVTPGAEPYCAFPMPTGGTITALSAKFILYSLYPQVDNTITAQLYYSPTLDNTFIPVLGATVALGTVLGSDPLGTVVNGIVTDLNVPVPVQTSLLLIFYNTTTSQVYAEARGVMQAGLLIK